MIHLDPKQIESRLDFAEQIKELASYPQLVQNARNNIISSMGAIAQTLVQLKMRVDADNATESIDLYKTYHFTCGKLEGLDLALDYIADQSI